jgi:hypothetical protein
MAIASNEGGSDGRSRKVAGALKRQSGLMGKLQNLGESLGWMG